MEKKILLQDFLGLMDDGERLRIRVRNVYVEKKKTEIYIDDENSEELRTGLIDSKVYVESFFFSHLLNSFVIDCVNED